MAEGGGIRRQVLPRKLTMEYYCDFLHSHKQLDLTVPHLYQIIDIHGYRKMPKTHKGDLMEAVKTMELIDPSRSTLGDSGISSDAFISLDDLIKDIKELQWQECCISSLQTINAVDHDKMQDEMSDKQSPASLAIVASTPTPKSKRPRKRLKKLSSVYDCGGDPAPSLTTSFDFGCSQRTLGTPLIMKVVPSKKGRINHVNSNTIGNHGDADLGVSVVSVTDSLPLEEESSAFLANG